MNDQPHVHRVTIGGIGGRIDYGDQYDYLHLMHETTPSHWPQWYLRWRTNRLIAKLIRRHDKASRKPNSDTMIQEIAASHNKRLGLGLSLLNTQPTEQWGETLLKEVRS
jgi:hypothetical protein